VESTFKHQLQSTTNGYTAVIQKDADLGVSWSHVAYALLPVWMLHTKWNGNDYLFAMNGQTGKLIGDLPIDNGKVTRRYLMLFVPILLVIFLIIMFVFGGYGW
jgi:hypothetical protein